MYIDPHVHCRDFSKQAHKETIEHALRVAYDSGVDAIFDMPNTDPPIINKEIVAARLKLAAEADIPKENGVPVVFYGLYMGLTADPEQIKQAVEVYRDPSLRPHIVGMKLYAGHSVGNLGVITEAAQRVVYRTLAQEGYDGVLAVHCEKESAMLPDQWKPHRPITHCFARPERAEVQSVKDQLRLAQEYGFQGKLHIAHISSPKAVNLVREAKAQGMDLSCGVCPHHFIYDWDQMKYNEGGHQEEYPNNTNNERGLLWKMNPPLRAPSSRDKMFRLLREGHIDWIETDHAPHGNRHTKDLSEKLSDPCLSGIPGLPWWPLFEEFLRQENFSDVQIERLTFSNAAKRFGIDVQRSQRPQKDHREDYAFNAYRELETLLGWKP